MMISLRYSCRINGEKWTANITPQVVGFHYVLAVFQNKKGLGLIPHLSRIYSTVRAAEDALYRMFPKGEWIRDVR